MKNLFNYDLREPPEYLWQNIEQKIYQERRKKVMKKSILPIITFIVVIGVASYLIVTQMGLFQKTEPVQTELSNAPFAMINFLIGRAEIRRGNQIIEAKIKAKLFKDDVLITKADSQAHLLVKALGVFKIKENSEIKIDSLGRSTKLGLKRGKLLTALKKLAKDENFVIETPTAVAGVRGTSFLVDATSKSTKIAVLTGAVEVGSGASKKIVNQYKKAVIAKDKEIVIAQVDKIIGAELKEIATIRNVENFRLTEIKTAIKKLELIWQEETELQGPTEKIKIKTLQRTTRQKSERLRNESSIKEGELKREKEGYIEDKGF